MHLLKFTFHLNIVNDNGAIFRLAVDALHAVVAYLVRVKVAAIALAAIVAKLCFVQDAQLRQGKPSFVRLNGGVCWLYYSTKRVGGATFSERSFDFFPEAML